MRWLIVVALLAANCTALEKRIIKDVANCAVDPLPTEVTNLVPVVQEILTGGAVNWQAQLDALKHLGSAAVLCAIEKVVNDLRHPNESNPRAMALPPQIRMDGATRGETYLHSNGVKG